MSFLNPFRWLGGKKQLPANVRVPSDLVFYCIGDDVRDLDALLGINNTKRVPESFVDFDTANNYIILWPHDASVDPSNPKFHSPFFDDCVFHIWTCSWADCQQDNKDGSGVRHLHLDGKSLSCKVDATTPRNTLQSATGNEIAISLIDFASRVYDGLHTCVQLTGHLATMSSLLKQKSIVNKLKSTDQIIKTAVGTPVTKMMALQTWAVDPVHVPSTITKLSGMSRIMHSSSSSSSSRASKPDVNISVYDMSQIKQGHPVHPVHHKAQIYLFVYNDNIATEQKLAHNRAVNIYNKPNSMAVSMSCLQSTTRLTGLVRCLLFRLDRQRSQYGTPIGANNEPVPNFDAVVQKAQQCMRKIHISQNRFLLN